MCRGATASNPLQNPHYGSALVFSSPDPVPAVQPILSFPYYHHLSQGPAIEDALSRAQAEAAMWRAGFEKGQTVALGTHASYNGQVGSFNEELTPASMATAVSDAFRPQQNLGFGQPLIPSHGIRSPADSWMVPRDGGARELAQSSANKQEQIPATPSDMAWDFSTVFDDTDCVSLKDLSNLLFPSGFALLETAASTPLALVNDHTQPGFHTYPAPLSPSCALYQADNSPTFWQGGHYSQGFAYTQRSKSNMGISNTGPGWGPAHPMVTTPPMYSTAVADMAEMLEPPPSHAGAFAQPKKHAQLFEEELQMRCEGKQEMGVLQHPGVNQVWRMQQPPVRSPRNRGDACIPSAAPAVEEAAAQERRASHVRPKSEAHELHANFEGEAIEQCAAPGCTRKPSDGFVPGGKKHDNGGARWCCAHAAEGMEDLQNSEGSCVGGREEARSAHQIYGNRRPSRSRAHREDGKETVRTARCHQQGCKRQPLYGEPGADKKPTHCRNHALPGMRDLRGAMCQGAEGTCGRRPSYGFRGDPRPTRCGSHKELGMEDLVSARCQFGDCRTVASYGVQALGSHVIRRTRCKAHRTPEMTCGTKGPACMNPGGCETRPSYGWPDKCEDDHPPRPERCKKHSLPGMEYMGSAARAKKRRATVEEERKPIISRSARQATSLYIPPTERPRLVRRSATAATPITEPEVDGGWEDTGGLAEQPREGLRNWSPGSRMRKDVKLETARLTGERAAVAESTSNREALARAERNHALKALENLGDMKALQELSEIEDQANDQMWGFNGPTLPELEGMLLFDIDCFV